MGRPGGASDGGDPMLALATERPSRPPPSSSAGLRVAPTAPPPDAEDAPDRSGRSEPSAVRGVARAPARARPVAPPVGPGHRLAPVLDSAEQNELVRRSQRGDRGAFAELFRRHRADVARLVGRMLGPGPDAEDVIQEVFLQVHRSLGEFRGQAKFTTWLHRVTVNVVLMARRAARSRPTFTGEPLADTEADGGLLPDEDAARSRRVAAFRRLLERLPEKKRTVFILHEIEGMSPAEIGEVVDAPVLTVRTRLFYARRELTELMREEPALAHLLDEIGDVRGADRRAGAVRPTKEAT